MDTRTAVSGSGVIFTPTHTSVYATFATFAGHVCAVGLHLTRVYVSCCDFDGSFLCVRERRTGPDAFRAPLSLLCVCVTLFPAHS